MKTLEKFRTRFEDTMSAIAYAEAGEFETARQIMNKGEGPQNRVTRRVEKSIRPKMISKRAGK
jgi:hypothetical protein